MNAYNLFLPYPNIFFFFGVVGVGLKLGVECSFQKHLGLWMIIKYILNEVSNIY